MRAYLRIGTLAPKGSATEACSWPQTALVAGAAGAPVDGAGRHPAILVAPGRGGPRRVDLVRAAQHPRRRAMSAAPVLVYLDQNYLSGIAKAKPAFRELEPVLRAAVAAGAVAVPESAVHHAESAPRPDLRLLELLRELSGGLRLPDEPDAAGREIARRLAATITEEHPARRARPGDAADVRALAVALPRCRLVTCDAFMADVVRRTRLDVRHRAELFTGRRADVHRLRERLAALAPGSAHW